MLKKEKLHKLKVQVPSGTSREVFEAVTVALLIALLLRAFVVEAFVIPSPSMVPTLLEGDFILVNKFVYGLRIPWTKKRIINWRTPKRGEIVVFMFPHEQAPLEHKSYKGKDFIKRVVGLPGDTIRLGDYIKKTEDGTEVTIEGQVFVNGAPVEKLKIDKEDRFYSMDPGSTYYDETLGDITHWIREQRYRSFYQKYYPDSQEDSHITVPQNMLFVMGDNRDNSSDSRAWGFVPMENLKGKALLIWMSLDLGDDTLFWKIPTIHGIRSHRLAKILQ
ncbi:MAG TPA: signal peptidase I [Bdellovibrionota bacterium]|nr:signal peptidase I [Bdellovibrionota bacterium]